MFCFALVKDYIVAPSVASWPLNRPHFAYVLPAAVAGHQTSKLMMMTTMTISVHHCCRSYARHSNLAGPLTQRPLEPSGLCFLFFPPLRIKASDRPQIVSLAASALAADRPCGQNLVLGISSEYKIAVGPLMCV